jgi:hypothetical protein
MSLFYVTIQATVNTTPTSLLKIFSPSNFESLRTATHSYLYRANDLQGAGKSKPEWMIMYEMAADERKLRQPITIESVSTSNPSIKIHRQGLYSLHTRRSSPTFSLLDFSTASNFLVAVFLRLDPAWKEEYDRYYTEEHMDAIAKVPGWRRTRRLMNAELPEGDMELAQFHDYDLDNGLSSKEFVRATSTKWYKDMMANAVLSKDRRTYELCNISSW